jgi:hypothetical protein
MPQKIHIMQIFILKIELKICYSVHFNELYIKSFSMS